MNRSSRLCRPNCTRSSQRNFVVVYSSFYDNTNTIPFTVVEYRVCPYVLENRSCHGRSCDYFHPLDNHSDLTGRFHYSPNKTIPVEKKRKIGYRQSTACVYYARGFCKNSESCNFSHHVDDAISCFFPPYTKWDDLRKERKIKCKCGASDESIKFRRIVGLNHDRSITSENDMSIEIICGRCSTTLLIPKNPDNITSVSYDSTDSENESFNQ